MRISKLASLTVFATVLAAPIGVWGQSPPTAPDNTGTNAVDRSMGAPTADQQANRKTDIALTRHIRRAIEKDNSLSVLAHQVKIITANGNVTLQGPVKTEAEKAAIGSKAEAIAGADKVDNQLSVTAE
jgi:hyperosmotically inducible protein